MKSLKVLIAAGLSTVAFASMAHAADLIVDPAPVMPGVVETSGNWDGAFVGAFGGYASGVTAPDNTGSTFDLEPAGWQLGVNAGVNFTLSNGIVAGVVGDIAWADLSDSLTFTAPFSGSYDSKVDWLGSLRGRVGIDGGDFLPYLTAGLAVAHNTLSVTGNGTLSDDQTHIGWTVGAGAEFAVTDELSIDLLYRYSDYGTKTYAISGPEEDVGLTAHQLTVGLNYAF
ncbi:outer membrane protein [Devosia sp.]|uniref:outer membrane protein n=1 Tax=Devosia sp. TaxID=1871048 RepID=UPI003A927EFE